MSNSFRVKLTPLTIDDAPLAAQTPAITLQAHYARLLQLRDQQASIGPNSLHSFSLANRILAQYRAERGRSPLGQLLIAAREVRNHIDRAVVVSGGAAGRASQMLFAACCHPYHNELSRGERGSKPRLYFDGQQSDIDHTQGLLDLLTAAPGGVGEQWALIVADAGQHASVATTRDVYLSALQVGLPTPAALGPRLLVVSRGDDDAWRQYAPALRIDPMYGVPLEKSAAVAVFTAQALLPASVVGLDIVKLLEGAALMHDHYRITGGNDNLVFRLAAWMIVHAPPATEPANLRIVANCRATEAVAAWFHREQELSYRPSAANPIPTSQLRIRLTLDQIRRDRLDLPANSVARSIEMPDETPSLEIRLARLDEGSLGQFCQLIMLANALTKHG